MVPPLGYGPGTYHWPGTYTNMGYIFVEDSLSVHVYILNNIFLISLYRPLLCYSR